MTEDVGEPETKVTNQQLFWRFSCRREPCILRGYKIFEWNQQNSFGCEWIHSFPDCRPWDRPMPAPHWRQAGRSALSNAGLVGRLTDSPTLTGTNCFLYEGWNVCQLSYYWSTHRQRLLLSILQDSESSVIEADQHRTVKRLTHISESVPDSVL